jgi:thymidylate synthase
LRNSVFPLLTTKKVVLRLIFEELMFFLRGQTDVGILKSKNVHIWDDNTSAEFMKKNNLPYEENDISLLYPYQWRSWGAVYKGKNHNHVGEGFDQLMDVINTLKTDPHSRRILLTSLNPVDAKKSVLWPCHSVPIQFYVESDKYLCCHMYQRSADCFLGAPYNIASTALFTYIMCELVNNAEDYKGIKLEPGTMIISLGDVHVYADHVDAVKQQLNNIPYDFPTLKFKRKLTNVDDIVWEDVILENYKSHDTIKAKMIA